MALHVLLLQLRSCTWRRVEQSRSQMRCLLLSRIARYSTSEPSAENKWTLDLDVDPEEINHAPLEEPHPQHPVPRQRPGAIRRPATTQGNRLLFNVGKKYMTADQFVQKISATSQTSSDFFAVTDGSSDGVESESGDRGGGWWGGREEEGETGVEGGAVGYVIRDAGGGEGEGWWGGREEGSLVGCEGVTMVPGKRRGYYSMRETKKFLKGRGMVGSRLTTPPTETVDLLECLQEKVAPSPTHLDMFSTIPSVLGSTRREVEGRITALRKLGFTQREVETILLAFSAILEVDYENVYAVCNVLKKYIAGGYMLRGLLMRHPFLFIQPVKQVKERIEILEKICRDSNALGFLLHNFPILLLTPLTPSTLHTITKYTSDTTSQRRHHYDVIDGGLGHSWVAKSLYHNLSTLPARTEPGPDITALIHLLAEFQLDPAPVFVKFPSFFKSTYAHVTSLLKILAGSPLYLDTITLRTLLGSIPDQLVWTEDTEQLQRHLQSLCSLFPSAKECCEKVAIYPGLVLPQVGLQSWLDTLSGFGFTSNEIGLLVSGTPNILLQNREEEFVPRLRLLLSVNGATPATLLACTVTTRVSIFGTPLNALTTRLNYALKHKPDMVSGRYLTEIFASRSKEFASFCGRSVEQLHAETGLSGVELKRFKSRQKSAKPRKLFISKNRSTVITCTASTKEESKQKGLNNETSETVASATTKFKPNPRKPQKKKKSLELVPTKPEKKNEQLSSKTLKDGKKRETKEMRDNASDQRPSQPREAEACRANVSATSSSLAYGAKPLDKQKTVKTEINRVTTAL